MKLIDKDALVAEIERRKHKLLDHIICESDKEWVVRTAHQLNRIIMFLDTLEVKEVDLDECEYSKKEEPVSEDLKEAAQKYADLRMSNYGIAFYAFMSGAKWQETKLMKDATEVTVHIEAGNYPYIPQMELYDYDKDVPLAKEGDKYKVILIKED